jgi:hypothetical protein
MMENHHFHSLINTPLKPNHPRFDEIWEDIITYGKIKSKFD